MYKVVKTKFLTAMYLSSEISPAERNFAELFKTGLNIDLFYPESSIDNDSIDNDKRNAPALARVFNVDRLQGQGSV